MRKIGIFGGTFNPIHNGHINLIKSFQEHLKFDEIILIPTNVPPHKETHFKIDSYHRIQMCKLAVEDFPNATVSEIEFEREEKSYTFVTLSQLKKLYPNDEFYLIMGSDMLLSLKKWYRYDDLKKLAVFCAAAREENEFTKISECAKQLEKDDARCEILKIDVVDISSTVIREKVMFGEEITSLVPKKVSDYIFKNNLYSLEEQAERFKEILQSRLSPKRYHHSLCVADSAVNLAKKYGANEKKAYFAGLIHDITKEENENTQLQIIKTSAIIYDEVEMSSKPLWHAITGAIYLENVLGVKDREVLDAVRWHTEFRKDATLLDKIIYLADFISADRNYKDVDVMRQKCETSLIDGLLYGLSYTIKDNAEQNKPIGVESVKAYNELLMEKSKQGETK